MAGEYVLVDALPYCDSGYEEPGVKQAAIALVEEECRRYKSTKNYLDVFGAVNYHQFETELFKAEFQRMEQRLPMEMLSMKRYELPPPPPAKQNDANAWLECVENSYAQLEHQATRIINLELMAEYGSSSWRIYNQTLKNMFDQAEKQLELIKKNIQNINLSRKNEQTSAGSRLKSLEDSWIGLVSKNYEIECAIVELEKELVEIKRRKNVNNNEEQNGQEDQEKAAQDDENQAEDAETLTTNSS